MIEDWNNPEYCLMKVRENPEKLKYVKNQTPEMCLEAVKRDPWSLKFVKNQTPELCLEAVKQQGYTLKFVKKQTEEICLEAIKQSGFALRVVKNQTPSLIHYLKKYHMLRYESYKIDNRITVSEKEMDEFYNENPHLLLTL